MRRFAAIYLFLCILAAVALFFAFQKYLLLPEPPVSLKLNTDTTLVRVNDSLSICGKSWLRLNAAGLWELYYEGSPYERGLCAGKLTSGLMYRQEKAFVDRIRKLVPSPNYLRWLNIMVLVFNRNINEHVSEEMQQEIYGISRSASPDFNDIAPAYERILNYHAAHDIGHLFQNLHLTGCTSFAALGSAAPQGMIAGRNFDFYAGDEFAAEKIVAFVKPDSGIAFMMVTWGGMTGVVSGMNSKGLCITLNAARSPVPLGVAAPVTLVARQMLQYASNISQAMKIASAYRTFVSESFFIVSAEDRSAAIIEKTPDTTVLFMPRGNTLICTNHFQSPWFAGDRLNRLQMQNTASTYRYARTRQLLSRYNFFTSQEAAAVLRDPYGFNDQDIGYGNEKAVNQFIAHHSVIFMPESRRVWISTRPWQLGAFVCYDLDAVFAGAHSPQPAVPVREIQLSLQPDLLLKSDKFRNFMKFRELIQKMDNNPNANWKEDEVKRLSELNPGFYLGYVLCGDFYFGSGKYSKAAEQYRKALEKVAPFPGETERIMQQLRLCYLKMN